MDQEYAQSPDGSFTSLARKSWTAYIGTVFLGLVLLLFVVPLAWRASALIGILVLLIAGVVIAFKTIALKSFHLYYDDMGVWLYSGVLPWKKGVRGVKWRDLDEAVYFQGLGSWLSKSYSLRVGHRFTKSNEILLSHMARGDRSVMEINGKHQELVRQNRLN
jgi:hypothetical protein